jgi:hypothetical protein
MAGWKTLVLIFIPENSGFEKTSPIQFGRRFAPYSLVPIRIYTTTVQVSV